MILLAPMEGLLDHMLRDTLTRVGGVDRCVSEFIRVTDQLLPRRVFTRIVPELLNGGRTRAGVPVRAQLLGSDPQCLAENAARLAELDPEGIDLNFGCPAKTVNRHRGGAVLLDEPELVGEIVAAVRRAVPAHLPVSAKMRLGNEDRERMLDCARAIEAAGASELVVHGRTKRDGYKPPAYWAQIAVVREAVAIDVVANGEVWTVEDALRCLRESGCHSLMLGRGMVADPGLALAQPELLRKLRDAAIIESFHPVHIPHVMQVLWDDVEATAILSIEMFEGFRHFHGLKTYLDRVGFQPPLTEDELVAVRRQALAEPPEHREAVPLLVNFLGSEHFAAFFFTRLLR